MDLIAAVADQTELSRAKATDVVDAVFGAIEGALKNKEEVLWSVSARSRPPNARRRPAAIRAPARL